ncbi:MAG: hypothetical protein ACPL68_03160 [Candidatus Hydrothermia bacterium]
MTAMPPAPGNYMATYNDDTLGWNPETEEELISPAIYIGDRDTLRLIYGLGYQNFRGQDTFMVRARFHDGSSWGPWQDLALYDWDVGSGHWDTLGLWAWLPAESLQFSFLWFDHTWLHWDWYVAVDNISLEYLLSLPVNLTASEILSPDALEKEGAGVVPALRVRNTGNQNITDNITARFTITDTSGILYQASKTIVGGLQAGDSVDFLFPAWTAGPTGGPYTATGFLVYQDSFPSDDTCRKQFGVIPDSVLKRVTVPYSPSSPAIDGVISPSEWDSATAWDASDYLARDGKTDYPGSSSMMAIHDASLIYLLYDVVLDTIATDSARAFVCLDDNADRTWPADDTTEGINRITNPDVWLCSWFKSDFTQGPWYQSGLLSFAFGQSGGHAILEVAIPMVALDTGPQFLGANPVPDGDSARVHIYYQDPLLGTIACWPQDAGAFYNPALYGVFYLEPFSRTDESAGPTKPWLFAPSVVRGTTEITLCLPERTVAFVALYDVTGRLTNRLLDGETEAGVHRLNLGFPSAGVYFLVARTPSWSERVKLVSVE